MRALLILLVLVAAGCQGPDPMRTKAERATYDAIGPEFLQYVTDDPALSEPEKRVRQLSVQSWDRRIRAYEETEGRTP